MLEFYNWLMQTLAPFLKTHLKRRLKKGKEDPIRLCERFGGASFSRPEGKLIWFHSASVGESMSILKLIDHILAARQDVHILVTSGTVTSAKLLLKHLPERCLHQYIPLDVPKWVNRFLDYWNPQLALFVESEFWPNLLISIKKRNIPLILLNASISYKSFKRWKKAPKTIKKILKLFDAHFTPSIKTASYLKELGSLDVHLSCNLKFAADSLTFNQSEFDRLKNICGKRVVWAATSTHEGEEELIIATHLKLKENFQNLLTILAPRHPNRANNVIQKIEDAGLSFTRLSKKDFPRQKTDIWLIDTIGDLGLVYALAPVSFVGGSFVPVGGHNPIEAFKLGSVAIVGPHTEEFLDVNENLIPSLIQVSTQQELTDQLIRLLSQPEVRTTLAENAKNIIEQQQQQLPKLTSEILEYIK